ncbi:UDP-glucose 4-epimerase [Faunimonas pinastri]|uniref:UDP-glucose 4-epimerase n=1 Tax=Faunimonas pinastri TaxID=1855383 RepID=A0A1H9EJ09_9HYPH|nr:NAD(P)-dependent oxidoreductase [Faunimonas pinastri]SEQ24998.1 UDP-glucose 4-epimerase [Faunimonas pinastri]
MKIVVTGSAGRVGSRMVSRLLEAGHAVTGFDLRPLGRKDPTYREVIGAFGQRDLAAEAMKGAEAVLHLGAFMSWLPSDIDRLYKANVDGTRVILEAAASAGVRRFLFASSGEVYPEGAPETLPLDESHSLKPRSHYGLTKLMGEELVRFFARTANLPFTILRFSHTQDAAELLDPASFFSGPRFFLQPKIRQQEGFGNKAAVEALRALDDGREALVVSRNANGRPFRMHITDTRDMVDGILLAFGSEAALGEVFNLGSTEPVDFAKALPIMAEATGLPLRTVDLPGAGVYYETSNAKIRELLGFEPKWTIERMIAEAADVWKAKNAS